MYKWLKMRFYIVIFPPIHFFIKLTLKLKITDYLNKIQTSHNSSRYKKQTLHVNI